MLMMRVVGCVLSRKKRSYDLKNQSDATRLARWLFERRRGREALDDLATAAFSYEVATHGT